MFNVEKHEVPTWDHTYWHNDDGPDFYSYMITDKNKYKPGENVRFKSYALSGSRNPIRRDLEVWLIRSGKPIQVGTITPHRPGSFVGEVHLHDSLKLTLDHYYGLQLWEKNGRVVSNCTFQYEDYDLHGNKLEVELETHKQFHPATNYVHIKATNENGLPLKDARATVVVTTDNIRETFQSLVILHDTLMVKQLPLGGEGSAIVDIPSSIFQKTNTDYYVHVAVLNSENRRMEEIHAASHFFSRYELTASLSNDSIVYQALRNGVPMDSLRVTAFRDGSPQGYSLRLPYKEKINPATKSIRFESDIVSRTFQMDHMLPRLEFEGGIEKDSFNISVVNPQRIDFSWFIYQGSELLEKGFGSELEYTTAIINRTRTYYVELLYSYGGSDHITSREYEFRNGSLEITLDLPDRVYPGQQVEAAIAVTNAEGIPVGGVDLTALATTAKLNYFLPDLPYYGDVSNPRSDRATYKKHDVNKRTAILPLDYAKWAPIARLDTMKYYQLLYPGKKIYQHQAEISDSTQFAVFVMKEGAAKKVHIIEVDKTPVYYAWTNNPKAYSFYVEPEKTKQVTLRLHDRVLIIDSLSFDADRKTILSLDLDNLPKDVRVHRIAPLRKKLSRRRTVTQWVFTDIERRRLHNYLAEFVEMTQPAYLESKNRFVAVSTGGNPGARLVVGPIIPGKQTYVERGRIEITYNHAGRFSYSFADNVVYKLEPPELIPEQLYDESAQPSSVINHLAINKRGLLEHVPIERAKWHPRVIDLADHACRVKVVLPEEEAKSGVASVLFQEVKTNRVVSPCKNVASRADYFTVPRGLHHVIVVYNNARYLKMDSVDLQSYTNIIADVTDKSLYEADSISRSWLSLIGTHCYGSVSRPSRTANFTMSTRRSGNVQGIILDETNMPLPGATVVVKGTTIGAVSDVEGKFVIDVPTDPSTLVFSFIGYQPRELQVRPGSRVTTVMEPDVQRLQEVVVVGYGVQEKRSLTGALVIRGMSSLSGKVAGLNIAPEVAVEEDIRTPGLPSEPDVEAERTLYEELLTLQSLRSNFSDVGFWEPRLFTDRHGQSKFTVTFPDDITRWDAVVYAMNRRLQTGTARKSVRSYKPLIAELHIPQFLTVGDSSDFLGKVLNYTSDTTIQGTTQWTGPGACETALTFGDYHSEKNIVVAMSSDTITTSFAFRRVDGYFDGEERTIPVVEQGTIRADGTLAILKNGDELHVRPQAGEVVQLEILNNPLDIYASNVRDLVGYRYDCNEQLASKLIGLLHHKLLMEYEGKPFRNDRDINKIIQRLLRNQNEEFLWSWWDVSPNTSYWMSAHILRALKAAKDAGYTVDLDVGNIARKATFKFDFLNSVSLSDIHTLHALATWDVDLDYAKYASLLDKQLRHQDSVMQSKSVRLRHLRFSYLNEKLLMLEIRQLQKLPLVYDSLLKYKKETALNEVYFSDGRQPRYWHSGDLTTNTIAYRIIRRDSTLSHLTIPMQMYFLSLRRKGKWNTYEASNAVMALLPDLLAQGSTKEAPATVAVSGKTDGKIQKFPFRTTLSAGEQLSIRKESGIPLYAMQYIEERVTVAKAGSDAFTLESTFSKKKLKAGEPIVLKATVEVKKDAALEHVMIEIPIPAGCSYAAKPQRYNRVETHREYFKDRTVIFCENMDPGTYVFQIELLPRFTGKYHVNPAQVSLMYFPVVNVNNDMKRVKIEEEL